MIQANELRIGNYVKQGRYGILPVNAYEISRFDDYLNSIPSAEYYAEWEPIPLTPELLEKVGFKSVPTKQYPYCYEKEDGDLDPDWTFRIWWWRDDICIEPFGRDKGHIGIEYLHQLQNLYFALTGRELPISL